MPQKKSKKKPARSAPQRTKATTKTKVAAAPQKGGAASRSKPQAKAAKATTKPKAESKPVSRPSGLAEGARAPDFRLPRDGGEAVSLADFAGEKLVVYFYPRAD